MTIGLDTSVLIRLLIGVPETQAGAARLRLAKASDTGERIVVTDLVLAETYHALRHHYGVPELEACASLERLLTSGVVACDPPKIEAAFAHAARGIGLVDRLIHARHQALTANTLTFDAAFAKLSATERLR